jgi:hypothetical protein
LFFATSGYLFLGTPEFREKRVHGPIQEIVDDIKGTDYTSGRNNTNGPKFVEQGSKQWRGEEGVLNPESRQYQTAYGHKQELVYLDRGQTDRGKQSGRLISVLSDVVGSLREPICE